MSEDIQGVVAELSKHGEQIKQIYKRMDEQDKLVESVHRLSLTLERLTMAQQATEKKVDGLTNDVEELKAKPAKRWDGAVTTLITVLLTAAATYALTMLGFK